MSVTTEKIKEWLVICEILNGCNSDIISSLRVDDGILWVYDSSRDKWLSSSRLNIGAGRNGRIKNGYLKVFDGQSINLSGWRIPRMATLTAIAVQTRQNETWSLQVRKNDDPTNIVSLSMNDVTGNHITTLNTDIDEGDRIQLYADTTSFLGIKDPLVWIEIAWRNDSF